MSVVAIRKSAWQAGNNGQRGAMRFAARQVELGEPALYKQANNTEWFVFSDSRTTLLDTAILGAVAAGLATHSSWVPPANKAQAREQIYNFVKANIVLPQNIAYTEIVQVEVPVRIQVEVFVLDENGDPTGETVLVWQNHPTDTQLVDVEQSLGDPYVLTLAAQGAPTWIAARESIPAGLSPVEVN